MLNQSKKPIYEDFVSSYEETALQILRYLGIAYSENQVFAERKLRKQADALSEDWARQYYQLKQVE